MLQGPRRASRRDTDGSRVVSAREAASRRNTQEGRRRIEGRRRKTQQEGPAEGQGEIQRKAREPGISASTFAPTSLTAKYWPTRVVICPVRICARLDCFYHEIDGRSALGPRGVTSRHVVSAWRRLGPAGRKRHFPSRAHGFLGRFSRSYLRPAQMLGCV